MGRQPYNVTAPPVEHMPVTEAPNQEAIVESGGSLLLKVVTCMAVASLFACDAVAQEAGAPIIRAGALADDGLTLDGILDEPAWGAAQAIDAFTQAEPDEGLTPTLRTTVQVLAGPRRIVIGIVCEDSDPGGIVSFSVRRDAILDSEDHVRIVLGPFLDGRSGYVFAVNPL